MLVIYAAGHFRRVANLNGIWTMYTISYVLQSDQINWNKMAVTITKSLFFPAIKAQTLSIYIIYQKKKKSCWFKIKLKNENEKWTRFDNQTVISTPLDDWHSDIYLVKTICYQRRPTTPNKEDTFCRINDIGRNSNSIWYLCNMLKIVISIKMKILT